MGDHAEALPRVRALRPRAVRVTGRDRLRRHSDSEEQRRHEASEAQRGDIGKGEERRSGAHRLPGIRPDQASWQGRCSWARAGAAGARGLSAPPGCGASRGSRATRVCRAMPASRGTPACRATPGSRATPVAGRPRTSVIRDRRGHWGRAGGGADHGVHVLSLSTRAGEYPSPTMSNARPVNPSSAEGPKSSPGDVGRHPAKHHRDRSADRRLGRRRPARAVTSPPVVRAADQRRHRDPDVTV